MAVFVVTNLNNAGEGSLREAVTSANSTAAADTIKFAEGLSGTINLVGQLQLTNDITIIGDTNNDKRADITIDANNANRIFDVFGSNVDVTLSSLTLLEGGTNALNGGAIKVGAGGGVHTLVINDTTIKDSDSINGGAIFSSYGAQVTINNSHLYFNKARSDTASGGAIYISTGALTVNQTTINNNSSNAGGGGIGARNGAVVSVNNSTVIKNYADYNGTGTNQGGGIYEFGATLNISNSIVAENNTGSASNRQKSDTGGNIDNAFYSALGGTAGSATIRDGSIFNQTAATLGISTTAANNGGSVRSFNITSPTSTLINAGSNVNAPATDANGNARIFGGEIDIGATEGSETITVTTLSDVVSATDGVTSLREAVNAANAFASPTAIVFQNGLNGTVALGSQLGLYQRVSINGDTNGDGDADITLTTTGNFGIPAIYVSSGVRAELTSLNFSGISNTGFGRGGVIQNNGILTLSYSVVANNTVAGFASTSPLASGFSAAPVVNTGNMIVNQTVFANNTATGGAGFNQGSDGRIGTNGGNASTSIINIGTGTLAIQGLALIGGTATGGSGGNGSSSVVRNGYAGGNGGLAVIGVLNSSKQSGSYGLGTAGTTTGGPGGQGGAGGVGSGPGANGLVGGTDLNNLNIGGTGALFRLPQIGSDAGNTVTGAASSTLFGLGGSDILTGSVSSTILGGTGHDTFILVPSSNGIGGLGNDTFRLNSFGDTSGAFGDQGIDTIDLSAITTGSVGFVHTGAEQNSVGAIVGIENFIGTNIATVGDTIHGTDDANRITGLRGNDVLRGLAGADVLDGGEGDDLLEGGSQADQLIGGAGVDTATYKNAEYGVRVRLDNLVLSSGDATGDTFSSIEAIEGSQFGDILTGDGLNNHFRGLGGIDRIDGGAGRDTADYSHKTGSVRVALNGSPTTTVNVAVSGVVEDIINNIENIIGGSAADSLTGDALDNTLDGREGGDVIRGGGGLDTLLGGGGFDMVDYGDKTVGIRVKLGEAGVAATVFVNGIAEDTIFDFENVIGSHTSADVITGNSLANALYGNGGDDKLLGDGSVMPTENANQIVRLYLATLGRGPDDAGLAHWTTQRDAGQSLESIATGFVTSDEFRSKYGLNVTNSAFVTLLYQNVLDRNPDTAGLNHWVAQLNGGATRESVVTGFSESTEFIRVSDTELHVGQTYRLYGATFGRAPDTDGFVGWVGALDDGVGILEAATLFIASPEFTARYGTGLTDTGFVTLLYQNVLGRLPDTQGLNEWLAALSGGRSRASVLLGFSDSNENITNKKAALNTFMQSVQPSWEDILVGATGNDDLGGGRGADTFTFNNTDNSADHVYGLEAWDTIQVTGFGFASKAAALANLTQVGANVVFSNQGDSITFHDTTVAQVSDTNWLLA